MAAYTYNATTPANIYSTEDYGTIASVVTDTDDFGVGLLSSAPTLTEDWSSINITTTQIPFGGINISGTKSEAKTKKVVTQYSAITLSGSGSVGKNKIWVGFGTVFEIGHGLDRAIRPYISSGTLRLGVYTIPREILFNSQTVTFARAGEFFSQTDYNFDSNLSSFDSQSDLLDIGVTFDPYYFGQSSALVSETLNPPENTELFTISGVSDEKFIITTYISSGQPRINLYSDPTVLPNVRTRQYGKNSNIGISTTKIRISGSATNINKGKSYVGIGTIRLPGIAAARTKKVLNPPGSTQLFTISGGSVYSKVLNPPENKELFTISGGSVYSKVLNPPENKELFTISGSYEDLQISDSYVGIGAINVSGIATVETIYIPPVDTELFTISGGNIYSKVVKQPRSTQLFTISGSAINIQRRKSYVGIGTTSRIKISGIATARRIPNPPGSTQLFRISGSKIEKYTKGGYTGIPGKITLYGSANTNPIRQFSYGKDKNIGIGTTGIKLSGLSRDYSTRYSGIGTIRINDVKGLTDYGANIPYNAKNGLIRILGTAKQSYTRTKYIGFGTATISSTSSNKKIAVYRNVGFGTIRIIESNIPSVFKKNQSYVGLTTIVIGKYVPSTFDSTNYTFDLTVDTFDSKYGTRNSIATKKQVHAYLGSGTINEISGSANSISNESRTDTILYNISGDGFVSIISNPPENNQLFEISGTYSDLKKTSLDSGIGTITVNGSASNIQWKKAVGDGLFKFITHTSDNVYDTVDSDVSVDYVDAAKVTFIANPPEDIESLTIFGSAITSQRSVRSHVGIAGTITVSESAIDTKIRKSYVGIGTIFKLSSGGYEKISSYGGSGFIASLSGSANSALIKPVSTSVLYTISGISSTRINYIGLISEIGTIAINNLSAITKKTFKSSIVSPKPYNFSNTKPTFDQTRFTFDFSNLGILRLYGEVTYPDVKFIPTPKGRGSIRILGSASKRHSKPYETSGSLFGFSGAFESYARKPYIGIGTITISALSGITVNNPYQIPRSYVIII